MLRRHPESVSQKLVHRTDRIHDSQLLSPLTQSGGYNRKRTPPAPTSQPFARTRLGHPSSVIGRSCHFPRQHTFVVPGTNSGIASSDESPLGAGACLVFPVVKAARPASETPLSTPKARILCLCRWLGLYELALRHRNDDAISRSGFWEAWQEDRYEALIAHGATDRVTCFSSGNQRPPPFSAGCQEDPTHEAQYRPW